MPVFPNFLKILQSLFLLILPMSIFPQQTNPVEHDVEWVYIPAGTYQMGSDSGGGDEKPVHRIQIDGFWMTRTEVTIADYLKCCETGQCRLPDWWNRDYFELDTEALTSAEWLHLPVTGVSWQDAVNYCKWKGNGYRLPTEAEWEYACRAGSQTDYFWGDDIKNADPFANVANQLLPVGSKQANGFGLYDMIGNIWEWCLDIYDAHYYEVSPRTNPKGPTLNSDRHVIRGGGWNEFDWNLRSANRSYGDKSKGYKHVGFRIVFTPEK